MWLAAAASNCHFPEQLMQEHRGRILWEINGMPSFARATIAPDHQEGMSLASNVM
jgi:hypothetical protein